ncbi:HlyD family secretion protein [Desertibaculum subflavum]|uniref:HlyD family secretion protein n=1 Tax=Desertibaculum subflavum TaxID=2268458 RepID=UPI000E6660B0
MAQIIRAKPSPEQPTELRVETRTEAPPAPVRRRREFRPIRIGIIAALLLAAAAYGGYQVYLRFTHVSEYDARVTGDVVTMSSRVDGWVVEMAALEGMTVEAGQVVARIDDRIARLRVEALKAEIAAVQAERRRLQAERQRVDNMIAAKAKTKASGVQMSEAARTALDADIQLARQELERARVLSQRGVVTDKQLETAHANMLRLESNRKRLDAERLQAEASLNEALAERDQLDVIDRQISAQDPAEASLRAQLAQLELAAADYTIRSPVPAIIDRTFVEPGEFVQAGQRILILHNPKELWVEANIKETQLRKLKLGQEVHITVDAFPDDRFMGKVTRIGSAATSRFALLPTPNPSGNFTKITQRVPVKVQFTEMPRQLSPGMMVEVDIDIR